MPKEATLIMDVAKINPGIHHMHQDMDKEIMVTDMVTGRHQGRIIIHIQDTLIKDTQLSSQQIRVIVLIVVAKGTGPRTDLKNDSDEES